MNQRSRLIRAAVSVHQERHTMNQRSRKRRVRLRTQIVLLPNLSEPQRIQVTVRPDELIDVRPLRQDIHSLRRPPKGQPQVVVLRRDDRPNLLNRPLTVVIAGPQQIPRGPIPQLLQQTVNQQILVKRQPRQPDLPELASRVHRSRHTTIGIRGNQSKTAPLRVEIRSPLVGLRVEDADNKAKVPATSG